jgi:hypothetical protein
MRFRRLLPLATASAFVSALSSRQQAPNDPTEVGR